MWLERRNRQQAPEQGHLHDLVDDLAVQYIRDKARAYTLDFMWPRFSAGEDRRSGWFHGDGLKLGLPGFEGFGDARKGASGANSGHHYVHAPICVPPDLVGCGQAVYFGVGRVLELLGHERVRRLGQDFFGLADSTGHAFGAGCQHEVSAKNREQPPPFDGHRVRHGQCQPVAAGRADESEGDTGVAARGFDDSSILVDQAPGLGIHDHRHTDAVLDAVHGIERLQLGHHLRHCPLGNPVQSHQGRVADQLGDIPGDPSGQPGYTYIPEPGRFAVSLFRRVRHSTLPPHAYP